MNLEKTLQLTPGGEANKHIMTSLNKKCINVMTESKDRQSITFSLKDSVIITHDEHGPMMLPSGTYQKTNQVEYDPFNDTVAYVFD